MDTHLAKLYYSHPSKELHVHTNGVIEGVKKRTDSQVAYFAALFHDLGKLNPNFQAKLVGKKVKGYGGHSYLSFLLYLQYLNANRDLSQKTERKTDLFVSVPMIIIAHHGNLKNRAERWFDESHLYELASFLTTHREMPASDYLAGILNHTANPFTLSFDNQEGASKYIEKVKEIVTQKYNKLFPQNPLDFFLETQFSFACLIEADKRDASDNKEYVRDKLNNKSLDHKLKNRFEEIGTSKSISVLNEQRTLIRETAVHHFTQLLETSSDRVFTLTAPTGAGKTYTLLALANELIKKDPTLNIIYALPFLSITEQVEDICKKLVGDDLVLRIDSRSENERIAKVQSQLENDLGKLDELLSEYFSQETFDHPFIITTFVQVFETLVSNRNATLLKLPNFANTIFLIDEIQALPQRLYVFFTAWLDAFCKKFNSYAIFSTATMPNLELVDPRDANEHELPSKLFTEYQKPKEILEGYNVFMHPVFNRYVIKVDLLNQEMNDENLVKHIIQNDASALIILNTIADSKRIHRLVDIDKETMFLLNTHFTLVDRLRIIEKVKDRLKQGQRVVLVSTQLVEAGVDIDFPVVYRDLCPLPSVIQSAGRCNRNGATNQGKIFLFRLQHEDKVSAKYIYDKIDLDFVTKHLTNDVVEGELVEFQKKFFDSLSENKRIGIHKLKSQNANMIGTTYKGEFDTLGYFRLIDEDELGKQYTYYIPENDDDNKLKSLKECQENCQKLISEKDFKGWREAQIKLESKFKDVSKRTVTFRLSHWKENVQLEYRDEVMGIRELSNLDLYSKETGLQLDSTLNQIL